MIRRVILALASFIILAIPARAADSTVSALTAASTLTGPELFYCVQGGADRKCTATQVQTFAAPTAANPTGTAGPTAVNGSATTFLRSDGAPAIQKATSGQFGIVEVDGTTVTATGGVISASTPKAGSNLVFQVATTGDDANPCTTLLPCLTIQHTMDATAGYDYQRLYFPTINVSAGTYSVTTAIYLPALINPIDPQTGDQALLVGDTTTPTNVIIHDGSGGAISGLVQVNAPIEWYVQGFEIDTPNIAYYTGGPGAVLKVGSTVFNDSTAGGSLQPFYANNYSTIKDDGTAFSILPSAINIFSTALFWSQVQINGAYTLPIGMTVNPFFEVGTHSSTVNAGTFVNGSTVVGPKFALDHSVLNSMVSLASTPGTGFTTDPSSSFQIFPTLFDNFARQISGAPTASYIDPGAWSIFKDTTQGPGLGITLKYNDAGTLYDVGPGVIATGSPPTLSGTCTTASQVGANTAGTFTATCVAQTVIITFATTAPNGWTCNAHDLSTPTDALNQTATSATSCTLTGTTVASDLISFNAVGF
jgi:hypothetical protein